MRAIGAAALAFGIGVSSATADVETVVPALPTLTAHPADPSNSQTAQFEWVVELAVTYQCRLDGSVLEVCVSPKVYSGLAAGAHTFEVKAVDVEGESAPASFAWTIDLTAPETPSLRRKPDNPSNDVTPSFTWDDKEAGATFECTVDGTSEPCTSGYETDPLGEGAHVFELRARDSAGNLSAPATWNWTVDLTAPTDIAGTPARDPDANGWYNHPVAIDFTSSDATATCASPTYSGPDVASVTVLGTCTDEAGNVAPTVSSATFNYDATPPLDVTGTPTPPAVNGWYGTPVLIAFTGSDATSGIDVCTSTTYDGADGIGLSVQGTCTDKAGNVAPTVSSATFNYDDSPPDVALTVPTDGSATTDATPQFEGTTNNGLADDDFVTVDISGPTSVEFNAPVAEDGSWSAAPATALAPGEYTATARQSDVLGRTDVTPARSFTIDPNVAQLQILDPDDATVTNDPSVAISGVAGDGAGFGAAVTVSVYSASSFNAPVATLSAPVSSGTWATTSPSLADGPYTIVAEQSDPAGGVSSDSVTVTIDTTPPGGLIGPTATPGYGFARLQWALPTTWAGSDEVVITKQRIGSSTVSTIYEGSGTLLHDTQVQNGYTYLYTFSTRDTAGNEGPSLTQTARPTGFLAPPHNAHVRRPPVLRWVDVPDSTYANVQLYLVTSRGIKKIWSLWPAGERLRLRSRWVYRGKTYRLRANRRYRIYGWPGFGARSEARYGVSFGPLDFRYR
jgi:hypothetical protein